MKKFAYYEPKSIHEALSLFCELSGKRKWLAGGTELLVKLKKRCIDVDHLINLKRIRELSGIFVEGQGIKIGTLTTLKELADRALALDLRILAQAAQGVASPNIRRQATIGGNLCQGPKCNYFLNRTLWGFPACYLAGGTKCNAIEGAKRCTAMSPVDTAPALIALGAKVEVVNANGERWVALEEFFNNPGATLLAEEEIITSIHIPRPPVNAGQQYLKFSHRGTLDYGIASVGVFLFFEEKRKVCKEARIILGGVDTIPVRALEAEELLRGREIKEVSFMEVAEVASKACHPWKDIETSSGYRRHLVRVLVKKALTYALENGEKGGDDYFKD